MPLKQLAYVPNHVKLNRDNAVDLLCKPAAKVKQPSTIQIKLSGKHADDLFNLETTGWTRRSVRPPANQLFGFSLTINETGHGSSVSGQL